MREELKHELRTILDYYYTGSALSDTIILNAMETAYRHGYLDAMQEMSRDEPCTDDAPISPECVGSMKVKIAEPVTPGHEPCDKVSHDCHIEYDKVSQDEGK